MIYNTQSLVLGGKLYLKPLSRRMTIVQQVGELCGFDSNYLDTTYNISAVCDNYEKVQEAFRQTHPIGYLYDNNLDKSITKFLFPSAAAFTGNHEMLESILRYQRKKGPVLAHDLQSDANRWSTLARQELDSLSAAHGFLDNGTSAINATAGARLTLKEYVSFKRQLENLHEALVSLVTVEMVERERAVLALHTHTSQESIPVNTIKALFTSNTTLSILRYLLTRLWMLEFFNQEVEDD